MTRRMCAPICARLKTPTAKTATSKRVNVRWTPGENWDVNFWYMNQENDAEGRQITNRLALPVVDKYSSGLRYEEPNHYENELIAWEVNADFGWAAATFVYGESGLPMRLGQRDQTDLLLRF